jgi:murein DD-endopeptidase MepM/ murein hydrolase activator NlpD
MSPPAVSTRIHTALHRICRRGGVLCVALAILMPVLLPTMAQADTSGDQAQLDQTRQALAAIQRKLAASRGQAAVIQSQVRALNAQISTLNRQVGVQTQAVYNLRTNIDTDNAQIAQLQAQYSAAQHEADARARSIYMAGPANALTTLLTSNSITDFIAKTQIWEIAAQLDAHVIIHSSRLKQALVTEQQALSASKADLVAKEGSLAARADLLNSAQRQQTAALDAVQVTINEEAQNEQALTAQSQQLTQALQADTQVSHSAPGVAVSATGLIWPVRGPITSPFGPRPSLGGFHYGIDIGAPTGTPIHAAKAGVIASVNCGSGYGICTIIDHGGGLTTLYAHQSRTASVAGEQVAQGQVIGYVGCTGFCTGPHLHFEVRINGVPHNPILYLPGG